MQNTMHDLEAVFFDWSGTLCNDWELSFHSTNATLKQFGGLHISKFEYKNYFELPVWKFYRRFLKSKHDLNLIDRFYFEHFEKHAHQAKLFPKVLELLKILKKSKKRLFIFSTVRQDLLESLCKYHRIDSYFEGIFGSIKDKERSFAKILKHNSLTPNKVLFVGDLPHDIAAANRAGALGGALFCGYGNQDELMASLPRFAWENPAKLLQSLVVKEKKKLSPDYPIATVGALIFHPQFPSPSMGEGQGEGESSTRPLHPSDKYFLMLGVVPNLKKINIRKGLTPSHRGRGNLKKSKILLIQTHKWSHLWGIPGGKVKKGESLEKALMREIREETGLTLKKIRFAMIQDCVNSKEFYKPAHFLLVNYTAVATQEKVRLNREAETAVWVPAEVALKMSLNEPTRILLENITK